MDIGGLKAQLSEECGIPLEGLEAVQRATDRFADRLSTMLPEDVRGHIRRVPIASLPLDTVDATISINDPTIVINWGLERVLMHFNEALVETVTQRLWEPLVHTVIACACAMKFGVHKVEWQQLPTPQTPLPLMDLIDAQLGFVLCHEWGHALLGHTNGMDRVDAPLVSESAVSVSQYNFSQKQEFDADNTGFALLTHAHRDRPWVAAGSVYRLLRLFQLSETMFPPDESRPSHPPARERWARIESGLDACTVANDLFCHDKLATSEFFDRLDTVVNEVNSRSQVSK